MADIDIRTEGRAGRITLNRPQALNALTWDMVLAIETALDLWRDDPATALVLIDAAGDKAFCAGGDIADMYRTGGAGDADYGRRFWRDEYRLNAKIAHYPKPIVTFLQGFTMGGGVGVGCHASHRIVGETSKIAMPECSIGLVPDVGGSLLLAKAPGYTGTYLGITGDRMDAGDSIFAGFADHFVRQAEWDALKSQLMTNGDAGVIALHAPPASRLAGWQPEIDLVFAAPTLAAIHQNLPADPGPALAHALPLIGYNDPLAMAVAVELIAAVRQAPTIATALELEYRFTARSVTHGNFIEGIRAAIIDRDRAPKWRHADWAQVPPADIAQMRAPLTDFPLNLTGDAP